MPAPNNGSEYCVKGYRNMIYGIVITADTKPFLSRSTVPTRTKSSGVKPFSIHPTVLNLGLATPPSVTNIAKGAVDIIVPSTVPLIEKDWDLLDEAVIALEGCWGHGEEGNPKPGKIVICESSPKTENHPASFYSPG